MEGVRSLVLESLGPEVLVHRAMAAPVPDDAGVESDLEPGQSSWGISSLVDSLLPA